MNALYPLPAFGELRGYYRDAAIAAEKRGDAEAAQANAEDHAALLARVMPPRLMPDTMDKVLEQRAYAHNLTMHLLASSHPYDLVRREGDFWARLDAIARRRAQA